MMEALPLRFADKPSGVGGPGEGAKCRADTPADGQGRNQTAKKQKHKTEDEPPQQAPKLSGQVVHGYSYRHCPVGNSRSAEYRQNRNAFESRALEGVLGDFSHSFDQGGSTFL